MDPSSIDPGTVVVAIDEAGEASGTAGSASGAGGRSQRVKGPMSKGSSHEPPRTART
ncbi:MAG: hypothetical protein RL698_1543 [Pseudomonadota bacterium]